MAFAPFNKMSLAMYSHSNNEIKGQEVFFSNKKTLSRMQLSDRHEITLCSN